MYTRRLRRHPRLGSVRRHVLSPLEYENILSFSSLSPSQTAQTTDRGDGRMDGRARGADAECADDPTAKVNCFHSQREEGRETS